MPGCSGTRKSRIFIMPGIKWLAPAIPDVDQTSVADTTAARHRVFFVNVIIVS
jgi:hypothetical protein